MVMLLALLVTLLSVVPTWAAVTVSWTLDSSDQSAIAGFHVYRSANCTGNWTRLTSAPVSASTRTYTDSASGVSTVAAWMVTSIDSNSIESRPSNLTQQGCTVTASLTSGIALRLGLNDQTSPTADTSGNNRNGVVSGATSWTTSLEQEGTAALTFAGSTGQVQVSGLLGSPAAITVSAWVRLPATNPGRVMSVLSLGDIVGIRINADMTVTGFYHTGSSWVTTTPPVLLTLATWHLLTYTVRAGAQQVFIDGQAIGPATTTAGSITWTGAGSNTLLGQHGNGGSQAFQGTLDDVRVWSRVLTPMEVTLHYLSANSPQNAPPMCAVTSPTPNGAWTTTTTPITSIAGTMTEPDDTITSLTWACPLCPVGSQSGTITPPLGTLTWSIPSLALTANATQTVNITATDNYGATGTCGLTVTYQEVTAGPVQLAWTLDSGDQSAITGFHVYRSASCTGPWTRLTAAPLAASTRSYTDTGSTSSTVAAWMVTTVDAYDTQARPSNLATQGCSVTSSLTTTLALSLPFNDQSSPTQDISGNSRHGTLSGSTTWDSTTPQEGTAALTFAGTTAKVTSAGWWASNAPTAVTLAAWVRIPAVTATPRMEVVSLGDHVAMAIVSDGTTMTLNGFYQSASGTWNTTTATPALSPATWTQVAYTVRAGAQQLYLNGQAVGAPGTTAGAIYWTGGGSSAVLGNHGATGSRPFVGTMDDVRVWNRVLSPTEIALHYFAATPHYNTPPTCAFTTPTSGPSWSTSTSPLTSLAGSMTEPDDTITSVTWTCPLCPAGNQSGTITPTLGQLTWSLPTLALTENVTQTLTVTAQDNYGEPGTCQLGIYYNTTPVTSDAELLWPLDDSGTTTADTSGHGHTGSLASGATRTTAGHTGGGVVFNGSSGAITTEGFWPTLSPSAVTLAAWVHLSSLAQADGTVLTAGDVVWVRIGPTTIGAWYADSSGYRYLDPSWSGTTTWHHLAFVVQAGLQEVYLDGTLLTAATGGDVPAWADYGALIAAGRHVTGDNEDFFTGTLDDLRIYPRALSATEVAALAGTPVTTAPPQCTITFPPTSPYTVTNANAIDVTGTATDDVAVTSLTGTPLTPACTGCGGPSATWVMAGVPISPGTNTVSVTARDAQYQDATCTTQIVYSPPGPPVESRIRYLRTIPFFGIP